MDPISPPNPQTLRDLLHNIDSIDGASEQLSKSYTIFRESFTNAISTNDDDLNVSHIAALSEACRRLADYANRALLSDVEYFAKLLSVLAVATREAPVWRVYFAQSETDHVGYMQLLQAEPDSVLEVARRVTNFRGPLQSSAFGSALKIIANCCANNNSNRKMIIHRDGVKSLLQLVLRGIDLDASILSLYNVCTDYDEPAKYSVASSHRTTDRSTTGLNEVNTEAGAHDNEDPSFAVECLAAAYSSSESFTTFELLLRFADRVSEHVRPYLAELVDMATQPALTEFDHIRSVKQELTNPWRWSFLIDGKTHDTVAYITKLSQNDTESLVHMNGAVLNLLSQETAVSALLQREDDAIWTLLTLSCSQEDDLDEETAETLLGQRRGLLKLLYQITGDSSFQQSSNRCSTLTGKCLTQLQVYDKRHKQSGSERETQYHSKGGQSLLAASACVVLAQLAASDTFRDRLLHNDRMIMALSSLLAFETSPDILYPALSTISRLSLASEADTPIIHTGILKGMQRLLTLKGIGMIVPVEAVIAYKTIMRNRPEVVKSLLVPEPKERTMFADVLVLWQLTMESGTRLEVGKFFLEVFRTVLPVLQDYESHCTTPHISLLENFRRFLESSAPDVAEVFVWLCLKAEPMQQRDHGWFGLAMLSIWPEARVGIFSVIDEQRDMRNEILRVSELQSGAVANNLMLMLSKLSTDVRDEAPDTAKDALRIASKNLGLTPPGQDV